MTGDPGNHVLQPSNGAMVPTTKARKGTTPDHHTEAPVIGHPQPYNMTTALQ